MLDFTGFAAIDIAHAMEVERDYTVSRNRWLWVLRDLKRREREVAEQTARTGAARPRPTLTGAHTPWI